MRFPKFLASFCLRARKYSRLFLVVILFVTSAFFIVTPYYFIYLTDAKEHIPVASNLEVTGFEAYDSFKVEAVANGFDFLEKDLDITVLGEVGLKSIIVFKNAVPPSNSSEILFNSKGKLNLVGLDLNYFSYILEGNASSTLSINDKSNSFFPPYPFSPDPVPQEDVLFDLFGINETCSIVSYNEECRLLLTLGAHSGDIVILGNETFSYPIINEYVSIILDVSIPSYERLYTRINGDVGALYLRGWSRIDYLFSGGDNSSLKAKNGVGEIVYSERKTDVFGTKDICFLGLYNKVQVTPISTPFNYRISLQGSVTNIESSYGAKTSIITKKDYFIDYLWSPYPILNAGITIFVVALLVSFSYLKWKYLKWDLILIGIVTTFSIGSLIWSVKTEQPVWIQNLWSFVPLYVNVVIFLLKRNDEKNVQ